MPFVQLIVVFEAGLLISAHSCLSLEMTMTILGQHELTALATFAARLTDQVLASSATLIWDRYRAAYF